MQKHQVVYGNIVEMNNKITDNNITDSKSSKFKSSITANPNNAGIPNLKIIAPLKYSSNFWRTLEMPLINFEVTLDLNWSENCVICEANRVPTVETKDYNVRLMVETFLINQ